MKLKTLELQGFKSFPDKTVITFDKGITVIVGPNGSGKSNISDAMRWVLGEMSSKSMRGSKMEDVIFAGSQKRSPMGYAEVTVTFDNSGDDGTRIESMAEYDEISVTRRYYRVGESEYFINRKQVRLRDVHELFMNTGLGKGGYSIIGQGKIAEIISQKNEERRAVFEEAAGIAKYRFQKEEAMRKLDATNTNLSSAEIILSELSGRVEPLKKEAEKARKYLEIYESKKAIDIALSLFDIDAASAKVNELSSKLAISKNELDNADETITALETQNNSTYEAFMQSRSEAEQNIIRLGEAGARISSADAEIRIAEASNEHYRETAEATRQKLIEDEKLLKDAEAAFKSMSSELDTAGKKKVELEESIGACDGEIAEKTREFSLTDGQISEAEEMLEDAKAGEVEARVAASVALERKSANEGKRDELSSDMEKRSADLSLYEERAEKAEEKIAEYDKKAQDIKSRLDEFDKKRADLDARRAEMTELKNKLYLDATQRRHRVQNLLRMEELLDGYSSAVRFIVNECKAGKILFPSGERVSIHGPVSKLIETEPKYSTALEVAFGASLQNIVVDDEACAKALIAHLKKKNGGRATLYPISTMRGREVDAEAERISSLRGFISVASRLVKTDAIYSDIIRSLIGRVIVCDNIDNATGIAKASGYRYKIVTLDGQVINAGGSFTGGSVSADGGMLSRRSQIDKLNAEIAEIEKRSAQAAVDEKAIDAEAEELKKESGTVLGSASVLKTLRDAEATQLEVIRSNIGVIKEAIEKISGERALISARADKDGSDAVDLAKKEADCREKQEHMTKRISELEREKDELNIEISALRAKRSALEIEYAREEKYFEMRGESTKDAEERLSMQREALERERKTALDIDGKIKANNEKISMHKSERAAAEAEKRACEEHRDEIGERSERLEKKLSEIRTRQNDAAHKRTLVFEEYTRLESAHTSMREKQESLIGFLWETYELTYSAASALGYEKITAESRSEAVQAQAKYKNIMRSLGNVNVNSIDEYNEVKERHEYYSTQIEDLHRSRADLEQIVNSLESRMKEDFARTVEEININFGKVFTELFGGGHAEIRITDKANILESGIEINVAPPGKIIKSLSLLSGGEQAFVAIALYFAILKVNPSPFCIMDEIESALDEINVDKFADYVSKYSEKTQFVLITHRRGTMEAAERLYGVTMHEKGISDVLSIDVSEIASKIGADLN